MFNTYYIGVIFIKHVAKCYNQEFCRGEIVAYNHPDRINSEQDSDEELPRTR